MKGYYDLMKQNNLGSYVSLTQLNAEEEMNEVSTKL